MKLADCQDKLREESAAGRPPDFGLGKGGKTCKMFNTESQKY